MNESQCTEKPGNHKECVNLHDPLACTGIVFLIRPPLPNLYYIGSVMLSFFFLFFTYLILFWESSCRV